MADTFLESFDETVMNKVVEQTKLNAQYFNDTVEKVTKEHSKDLDEIMYDLSVALTGDDAISDLALERFYGELTNILYFTGEKLEKLAVLSDMAKSASKESYNKVYLDNSSLKDEKGKSKNTVAENQAIAEQTTMYESTVSTIYEHAYKSLKFKIEGGYEMCTTLKNIMKKRMQESEFDIAANYAKVSGADNRRILNE